MHHVHLPHDRVSHDPMIAACTRRIASTSQVAVLGGITSGSARTCSPGPAAGGGTKTQVSGEPDCRVDGAHGRGVVLHVLEHLAALPGAGAAILVIQLE